jgi:hypothetical protein
MLTIDPSTHLSSFMHAFAAYYIVNGLYMYTVQCIHMTIITYVHAVYSIC